MIKMPKERKRKAVAEEKKEGATHIGNNDRGPLANYADQKFEGNSGGSIHYGELVILLGGNISLIEVVGNNTFNCR